jgi:hypothetical protein
MGSIRATVGRIPKRKTCSHSPVERGFFPGAPSGFRFWITLSRDWTREYAYMTRAVVASCTTERIAAAGRLNMYTAWR